MKAKPELEFKMNLIKKYLAQTADAAEEAELKQWLSKSERNRELFRDCKLLHELDTAHVELPPGGFEHVRALVGNRRRQRYLVAVFVGVSVGLVGTFVLLTFSRSPLPEGVTFNQAPLITVTKEIERVYGVTIEVEQKLKTYPVSVTTFGEVTVEEVLKAIARVTNGAYERQATNQYILYGGP